MAGPSRTGGPGRLLRRVRLAGLAPRLRERHEEQPGHGLGRAAEERRPEQARSMLAALRDGTRRARAQDDRIPETRHAVVLSEVGLLVGSSAGFARAGAEHPAAIASGVHSLAQAIPGRAPVAG
ncbi:roadblock/LC7 domain-containing protein [Streptomyces sp. NPDC001833]|uniref:roadblock/LC7 domain-containing protein n=1 Tax=Streptomyces sp. NPDC001833 TaxID=3154658 RepID=UPI0033224629